MDSDYCLICDKKTLGGIYCSQTCRLTDLKLNNRGSIDRSAQSSEESVSSGQFYSTVSSPSASPQFAPTRSSNLPSLPILNTLDRYLSRSSPFSTTAKPATNIPAQSGNENTSIWRRRSILFYTT